MHQYQPNETDLKATHHLVHYLTIFIFTYHFLLQEARKLQLICYKTGSPKTRLANAATSVDLVNINPWYFFKIEETSLWYRSPLVCDIANEKFS